MTAKFDGGGGGNVNSVTNVTNVDGQNDQRDRHRQVQRGGALGLDVVQINMRKSIVSFTEFNKQFYRHNSRTIVHHHVAAHEEQGGAAMTMILLRPDIYLLRLRLRQVWWAGR